MRRKNLIVTVLLAVGLSCASNPASEPKMAGDAGSGGAAKHKALEIDYSKEDYRVVAEQDLVCTVLKNGLTIIAKRIPSPVLSVQGLCRTGSIYEGKWLGGGLSHLLEHLLAGGTNERRSEQANRDLLQQIGNNSNAFTTTDNTCFFVNTTPPHMTEAIDLVTGWMFTSKIPEAEYEREYEVVQRELEKDNGEADWAYYQLANQNRYIVHPTRMPVVGYQEVIRGLSRDDVYAYYKYAYVPQNIIIAVAGNADPEEMVKAVRKYAGNVPPGRMPDKSLPVEPPVSAPRISVATFPKLGQAKLQIAFPSVKQYMPDMYSLDVLSVVLGGGESSILVEELRDKRHLVTAVGCTDNTPAYVEGSFTIDMDLPVDKIKPATDAVMEILDQVKKKGVEEERVARARVQLKATDAYQRQSAEALSTNLCYWYMTTGYPEDVTVAKYQKVTAAQVKAAANKYLDTGRLLTTALLPAEAVAKGENEPTLPAAEALLRQAAPTTRPAAAGASEVAQVTLEDGTVVLIKRVATAPVVSVQLYSLGGLTVEDEKSNGLGNLAMETVDRGTKTRSAEDIATFFDSIGGQFQTTCGNNSWVWHATFLKDDLAKAVEVFADVVKNPIFPDGEVKDMKERVVAAIESQDRDWFAGGNRYFRSVFFGPGNSPYQFTAMGKKEQVESITADQVRQWYRDKVLKGKKVLAIYGDIDPAAAKELVAKHFGAVKQASKNEKPAQLVVPKLSQKPPASPVPSVTVDEVKVQKWENPESVVFIGFKSDSLVLDAQRDPLIMADTLTSGFTYPTGYIFETLRGLGLVYDANAQNHWGLSEKLPGTFWAYAACDAHNIDACIDQMLLHIARLQGSDTDIDTKWFNRAEDLVATADAMDHETAAQQAAEAALDELYGLGYDYHVKFAERIKAVKIDQVREVAKARLRNCVIAVSTDHPELVKAKEGTREYKSFPPVDLTPKGVTHDSNSAGK